MKKHFTISMCLFAVLALFFVSCGESGKKSETVTQINGHECVDLGLPSGLKWATCNVGATAPEEYGGYFAWGETEVKDDYSFASYKWCKGNYATMTKYCTSSNYGTVDDKTVLDPEDDVAHVQWGGSWRMPTLTEQQELLAKCKWQRTELNGVPGFKVIGPNGNSIFLPAAGCVNEKKFISKDVFGYYWSSTLYDYISYTAYDLYFGTSYQDQYNYHRYNGLSVRAVSK